MWSHNDPVTLFGAGLADNGWDGVRRAFERVASRFGDCTAYDFEILAAGASGDLAYTVGYEHTSTSVGGDSQSYDLRVTNVYRREEEEWKVVTVTPTRCPSQTLLIAGSQATPNHRQSAQDSGL